MKPLACNKIDDFLDRFCNFCDGEIIDIKIISPTVIHIEVNTQDKSREFNWISVELELNGVLDARLIGDGFNLLDMSEGIGLACKDDLFHLTIPKTSNTTDAKCYIMASSLKYKEKSF